MALIGVSSPLRLLRETWRNPTMLAQELYAMFTSREPITTDTPVEIRVPKGETGLTITQTDRPASEASNAMAANRVRSPVAVPDAVQFERATARPFDPLANRTPFSPESTSRSASSPVDFGQRAATTPYEAPAFKVNGEVAFTSSSPVQFQAPPVVMNPDTGRFEAMAPPATTTPPRPTCYGVVTGGSNGSWSVAVTAGNVIEAGDEISVTVPYLAKDEKAPEGATIGPIVGILVGNDIEYYYQPPVWMP